MIAAAVKDVRLDAWQWLALTGATWAGSLVFAALGVAIGYLASGDAVRPVTMIVYFGLPMLGGLWMPTTTFPDWLQVIAKWLPTHAYAALGQAIEQSRAPHLQDLVVLVLRPVRGRRGLAVPEGHPEGVSGVGFGIRQRPVNRRQRALKSLWTGIWPVCLSAPVTDLLHGGHGTGVRVLGWLGLAAFVTWYMLLLFRTGRGESNAVVLGSLGVLAAQSTLLALTLGRERLVLFVYVSIASGAALPPRMARWPTRSSPRWPAATRSWARPADTTSTWPCWTSRCRGRRASRPRPASMRNSRR